MTTQASRPLHVRWVRRLPLRSHNGHTRCKDCVWVVESAALADRLLRQEAWPPTPDGYLVLTATPRPEALPLLQRRFKRVAYAPSAACVLPPRQLREVLKLPDRADRFIAALLDPRTGRAILWRGDLSPLEVPLSAFAPTAHGVRPDWRRPALDDYGHTVRFGSYEAASDSLLYEFDGNFRRRLKKQRAAQEQGLGPSIRRLRQQRQVRRTEFADLHPRTLLRIERGQIARPHPRTLAVIAARLGVPVGELGDY